MNITVNHYSESLKMKLPNQNYKLFNDDPFPEIIINFLFGYKTTNCFYLFIYFTPTKVEIHYDY